MSELATTGLMLRRVMVGVLLVGLIALAFRIVQPFLAAIAWAAILCYVTWPAYLRLRHAVNDHHNIAALLMTALLAAALVLPLAWLGVMLESQLVDLYQAMTLKISSGPIVLPEALRSLPVMGDELQKIATRLSQTPDAMKTEMSRLVAEWRAELTGIIGGVGKNLAKFGFALLTAFFFYRDGEVLLAQVSGAMRTLVGEREQDYIDAAGETTRAVVYGIVATAMAQGALAGVGYWIFGAPAPLFLAAVTTVAAMVPFATPFVWAGVSVWMLANGMVWGGVGLALWGTFLVSWIDNIIRPLVISSNSQVPFILVLFGVLGGLANFGMIGLFVGPVILAVLLAVWREWLEDAEEDSKKNAGSDASKS